LNCGRSTTSRLIDMVEGLVSTVIPVFNRATMLREAVASVLAQSWRPIEIVIVDDGSTDDTMVTALSLHGEHPKIIKVLGRSNEGPGAARQAGLEAATGEFVQFLDSDDVLLPDKFSLQVIGLRNDPEAGISYGKTYTREDGVRASSAAQRTAERHRHIFPSLLTGRLWETSTPLYRRVALDRIGPWPRKRQMEDWEFDAKAGAAGVALHHCDKFIAEYRIHTGPRLAHAWMSSPQAMRDRLSAYVEILKFARQAEVANDSAEMQLYARTLFWIAREAGKREFAVEAMELLDLARQIAATGPRHGFDIVLYREFARTFGWKTLSTLSKLASYARARSGAGEKS
jgi:glycosyltransferase involved in cell wall biosynthesis